jgi:hypothetical protein
VSNRFANGRKAFGFCDVCGFRFDLKKLKNLVVKTKQTQIKACPQCWTPDQPQLQLGMYPVADPQAIRDPRPDTNTWYQSGTNGLQTSPTSGLLPANPFTADGTTTVLVNAPNHGALTGTYVTFSGATVFSGVVIVGQYQLTVVNANSYAITYATPVPAGNGGGSAVTFAYQPAAGVLQQGYPGEGMLVIQWGWNPIGGARDFDAVLTPNTLVGVGQVGQFIEFTNTGPAPVYPTDPYFANVVLLMHLDGSNNSTAFIDSSSYNRTLTANNGVKITTVDPKFGTGSVLLIGNSPYIAGYSSGLLRTNPWTLEFWAKNTLPSVLQQDITLRGTSGLNNINLISIADRGIFQDVGGNTSTTIISAPSVTTPNFWFFCAVVNDVVSNRLRLFVNGVQIATRGGTWSLRQDYALGATGQQGNSTTGIFVDEIRFTNGVARYTSNFTIPTTAFPNS